MGLEMINKYISKQFGNPTGIGGIISTAIMNFTNKKPYETVANNLKLNNKDKILDIGFGNAKLLNKLSQNSNAEFYGLEYSNDMYKRALNKFRHLNLNQGNILESPYSDVFFDSIYTVNTIYFWEDIDKGLEEVKRIIKKDGVFLNVFYSKEWLENIKYTDYGFNRYTVNELIEITVRSGFEIIELIEISKWKSYCVISKKV